ncbi:MAG: HAD family hydrolase [Clostridiales bacterium]|nr:HAD family hydrolase [Clostridiales bacterium]
MAILIFDYFETLLTSRRLDFNQGLKLYWEKYYKDRCSLEEMTEYGKELLQLLLERHAEGKEFSFACEELPMYAEKFGVEYSPISPDEEADFLMACNDFELSPGIDRFLIQCKQKNTPMYVVSNSGFSASALKIVLDRFGIGSYFKEVWSSAEFGRIKPCKEFFELAIQTALSDNPPEKKDDIIYIGDLYETDVAGANRAGIKSCWINRKGEEDPQGIATYVVGSTEDLLHFEF